MTEPDPKDALLERLGELPAHDLPAPAADRVARRARGVFLEQSRLAQRPWLRSLVRIYDLGVEPALVASAAAIYLAWALRWVVAAH